MLRKKSAAARTQPDVRQVSPPKAFPIDSLSVTSIRAVGCNRDLESTGGRKECHYYRMKVNGIPSLTH